LDVMTAEIQYNYSIAVVIMPTTCT
jgi:hypothetical protein